MPTPVQSRMPEMRDVTLKEYVDVRMCALEKRLDDRIGALEKATEVAYANQQVRLAGMNEIRDQLRDQASTFITRADLEACVNPLAVEVRGFSADIRMLREAKATIDGKASQQAVNLSFIFAAIGALLGVIGLILQLI